MIDGTQNGLARRGVVGLGVDGVAHHGLLDGTGQGIELGEPLHLLVEQLHPQCQLVRFGRVDVDHLPPHPEGAAAKRHVVAGVLQLGEAAQYVPLVDHIPHLEMQHHAEVGLGVPQTIDGRYRGDDHHVAPLQQRLGGRQPHLLDVIVDGGILLDEGVRGWHIGFRLVVVVIGDEVLHRVLGEELLHLPIELGGQGLVGSQYHGRAIQGGDDVGHGEGLARPSHPEQGLMSEAGLYAIEQAGDGRRLIPRGLKLAGQLERLIHDDSRQKTAREQCTPS
ncbi:hypothetical protein D3C84_450360 [compost metagenome]